MSAARFGFALAALSLLATGPALADAADSRAAFDRALSRFQAGDFRSARVELLNALKDDPANANARLLFARVLLARGNGVAAQTEIEHAVRLGVPRAKTHHLMANALLLQRQPSRALDEARSPDVPAQFASYAARMRGRAEEMLGNPAVAREELDRAVQLSPNNSDAYVDLARFQAGTGDVPGAMRSIDRAIALAPNNGEAVLLKGTLVRAVQGPGPSLPLFDRALQIDGNNIEALLERAATLADVKRTDAAQADLKKVLGLNPGHPIALYLQAAMAARAGKFADAQTLLASTKGMLDKYSPAQMLKASLALQQGNLGVAFDNLNAVVAASPHNVGARRLLADVQLRRGDPRGALTTLQPLGDGPGLDAGTLTLLGSAHAQAGEFAQAQGLYERAAKLAPSIPQLRTQLAMTRMALGDAKGAVAGLNDVLKTDPKALQPLTILTGVQLRAHDFGAARQTASRIVAAYPNLAIGYHLRASATFLGGDPKSAEADYRTAIAKDPKFLDAQRNLAQLLMQTGRADQGRQQLQTIVAANPRDLPTLGLLADIAGRDGRLAERIDWLRRAENVDPHALATRRALVETYVVAGRPGDALSEATGLARDRPNDPVALQLLGGAQMANKEPTAGIQTFQRIVDLAPKALGPKLLLARAQSQAPGGANAARATLETAIRQVTPAEAPAAYGELIRLEMREKRPDAALAAADRLKAVTPQKAAADKLIGDINMEAGRPVAAIAAYQRVRAKVNNGQVAALIAAAQQKAGQPAAALATLQAYRQQNPRDLAGGVALTDFYITQKNWRAVIDASLSMKNTAAAGSPLVLNNLAYAYAQVGDPRALAAAARANQLAPNQPTIEDTYGWILVKTGRDPKRGLALLQAAAKGMPGDPNVRYHYGLALKANGQNADAARELKAALASPALDDPTGARAALAGVGT